jgi:hypothetical protein
MKFEMGGLAVRRASVSLLAGLADGTLGCARQFTVKDNKARRAVRLTGK